MYFTKNPVALKTTKLLPLCTFIHVLTAESRPVQLEVGGQMVMMEVGGKSVEEFIDGMSFVI